VIFKRDEGQNPQYSVQTLFHSVYVLSNALSLQASLIEKAFQKDILMTGMNFKKWQHLLQCSNRYLTVVLGWENMCEP